MTTGTKFDSMTRIEKEKVLFAARGPPCLGLLYRRWLSRVEMRPEGLKVRGCELLIAGSGTEPPHPEGSVAF